MSKEDTALVVKVTRPGITKDEVQEIYADWAQNYDAGMKDRATPKALITSVIKDEKDKSIAVLDLAAGTGVVGKKLAENGFTNLEAYDGSAEMLKQAKSKNIYQKLHCQLIGGCPSVGIKSGSFDLIVCCGAFYPGHLDETCLVEILRMLKKGGRFYFTRLHYESDPVIREIEQLQERGLCNLMEKTYIPGIAEQGDGYVLKVKKSLN